MYRKMVAPILVNWEVTPLCNHNCLHCYNYWRDDVCLPRLTDGWNILNTKIVNEIVANRVFTVIVTGGEPLLVLDEVADNIRFLSDNGVSVFFNSNLTLLSHERAKLLKSCKVKSILVSLPSADPVTCDAITNSTGSLERIKEGILIAKEYGFKIFVNMVVSKFNVGQVFLTAEFVKSLGLNNFAATRASDPSSHREFAKNLLTLEEFRIMQNELNEIRDSFGLKTNSLEANPPCSYGATTPYQGYKFCCAGKSICTIGYNGDIRPCNRSVLTYGNIRDGLCNAWDKMVEWRDDSLIPEQCFNCKLKNVCCGGCKADALKAYGDMKKPDPLCDIKSAGLVNTDYGEDLFLVDDEFFLVNKNLLSRQEEFGILIYTGENSIPVSFELAELLLNHEKITLVEVQECLGVNRESAIKTVSFLVKKKIIFPLK